MYTKRLAYRAAALALAAVLLTTTALACGGHRGRYYRQTASACYELCSADGCETAGLHTHDGVTYCGYAHAGGSCDGTCAALCTVEDCQVAGRHFHDGTVCCGYAHEGCFCDGSCVGTVSNAVCGGRRHHGGHC